MNGVRKCHQCGHALTLEHGLDILEPGCKVEIWCVMCGRKTTVTDKGQSVGNRINERLMKTYKEWR